MSTVVVVGNPKPTSRTRRTGELVAAACGDDAPSVIDLAELGAELLDWSSDRVAEAKRVVADADLVVVASPTYKGAYTGLLKLFLDLFGADELLGVTAIPVMLGGDLRHSLAVEVSLKPVLVEIGLSCPTRGLFLPDSQYDDAAAIGAWAQTAARSGLLRERLQDAGVT